MQNEHVCAKVTFHHGKHRSRLVEVEPSLFRLLPRRNPACSSAKVGMLSHSCDTPAPRTQRDWLGAGAARVRPRAMQTAVIVSAGLRVPARVGRERPTSPARPCPATSHHCLSLAAGQRQNQRARCSGQARKHGHGPQLNGVAGFFSRHTASQNSLG